MGKWDSTVVRGLRRTFRETDFSLLSKVLSSFEVQLRVRLLEDLASSWHWWVLHRTLDVQPSKKKYKNRDWCFS